MNNFARRSFFLGAAILFLAAGTIAQQTARESYKILGVSVEGNDPRSGTESSAIIERAGLKIGDEITVPGDQTRQAIVRLWALRIFSDIQILIDRKVENGIYLLIKVSEHPRLSKVEIKGADDVSEDDINKKISVVKGQILTLDDVSRTIEKIKALYEEEGHLLASVKSETIPEDSSRPNQVILRLNIDEGPRIRIDKITVTGNIAFSESDIKGAMEDTKEKSWWQFWSRPKFDKKKFEDDKQKILRFFRKQGYLDAEIVSDSTWYSDDKKNISVSLNVSEGAQYKIRTITWDGISVYKPEILSSRFDFQPGDIYDEEKFEKKLHGGPDENDVASLYLDNGYLMFNLEPEIKRVNCDSSTTTSAKDSLKKKQLGCLDLEMHVYERNQFRIGKIDVRGNTKTHDNVIRRELYTKPGDFYNQSAIVRSLRQLAQLNYFEPEKLYKGFQSRPVDDKTVDLVYDVEEKSSDNVNASVGYSGAFGVTGAVGFTINNFSIAEPLAGGAGQVLNFEWQFGEGSRFRTFSLSFTEPWLYNTPTTLGISLYDTRQVYGVDLQQTGLSVRLGRRLKWPDDFFRADWTFRFQNLNVHDNGGLAIYQVGQRSQYSVNQTFTRNSTDSPIFPAVGSIVSFSTEISGPPLLPGTIDYHKWMFNTEWFTPLFNSTKLVLFTSSSFGYVNGFHENSDIPYTEKFFMGGTGIGYIATTPLRGYEDRTIGPRDNNGNEIGGNVMVKHSAELRFAVTLSPMPIYLLGFAESGNVFSDFKHTDFFNLYRSYGFGARLLINPIGLVGFDYGYGADDVYPNDGQPDGWHFHFQFGRGF